MKYLYSEENKTGVFIEDILLDIVSDIEEKNSKIESISHPTAIIYQSHNRKMIETLKNLAYEQEKIINYGKENPIPKELLK